MQRSIWLACVMMVILWAVVRQPASAGEGAAVTGAAAAEAPADDVAEAPGEGEAEALAPAGAEEEKTVSLWQVIRWGGAIEVVIILCSFAAMTLVIEHFVNIRSGRAIPADLVQHVSVMMRNRQYSEVLGLCQARPCLFGDVVTAGLQKLRHDFAAVQESLADTIERQGIALHAKIGYLAFLANVCPMLGLLGTVWGMIKAFNRIANEQGLGRPKLLAEGVSQALITTATGLIVAIPVMAFVFFFRERANRIILEVETATADLFEVFRPSRKIEDSSS